jgi:alpha-ribazole phosphatase
VKITFIRHTSVDVETGICYGQSDVDVSAGFENEAAIVKSKLDPMHFDAVFSSPLQRCVKLAQFCEFSQPNCDDRLMEMNFGAWEMKPWSEITDPQLQRWFDNWENETPTQGESFKQLISRVENFLVELKSLPYHHVAIFTHAGVIRSAGIIADLFCVSDAFDFKVEYGDVFEIDL